MSAIRIHILNNGRLRDAGCATAVEVLGLAVDGYLTVGLTGADRLGYRTPVLERTDLSARLLWPEQLMLLNALFGSVDAPGSQVCLSYRGQVGVAQTLMATTRALLVREKMIRPLRPRVVSGRLLTGSLVLLVAPTLLVLAGEIYSYPWASVVAFFLYALMMPLTVAGILVGRRAVFRTARGRAEARADLPFGLAEPASHGVSGEVPRLRSSLAPLFRDPTARTLSKLCPDRTAPSWWRGDGWTARRHEWRNLVAGIEKALDQRQNRRGFQSTPATRRLFEVSDYRDRLVDLSARSLDRISDLADLDNAVDLTDWSGGGGGGYSGDGGYGGDGGGGGDCGGGGDGGGGCGE